MGNKILGLDMVVRDKHGHLLDPDNTSTIDLYNHHKNATERMNLPKVRMQKLSSTNIISNANADCIFFSD